MPAIAGTTFVTADASCLDRPGSGSAMNRFEKLIGFKGEAKVRYLDGEVQVLAQGDFVRCAVTGAMIPLAELRYWNVDLQEPYATAEASLNRMLERRKRKT